MVPRRGAIFASIMVCMSALRVLRVTLRALATATPRVLNVAVLFVAHEMGGPQHVR